MYLKIYNSACTAGGLLSLNAVTKGRTRSCLPLKTAKRLFFYFADKHIKSIAFAFWGSDAAAKTIQLHKRLNVLRQSWQT